MSTITEERLLILTKTYPSPSRSYRETVCVAAVNEKKEIRRLYPIAFRFLQGNQQFKRWQWITAKISKSSDKRPESYNIDNDTIQLGNLIDTSNGWRQRIEMIEKHVFFNFSELESSRLANGTSLGFIKPIDFKLSILPARQKKWTEEQLTSIRKSGLFDPVDVSKKPIVQKIPYDIYYDYQTKNDPSTYHHILTDWEVGALYWKCQQLYGSNWEIYFRKKLEDDFKKKDMFFLLGTMHQFPDQWLIIGLVYPPITAYQPHLL